MTSSDSDHAHLAAYQQFLQRNRLPEHYLNEAKQWFTPLIRSLYRYVKRQPGKTILVVISGCQGSGKSTLADYLCTSLEQSHNISAIKISLDDFYLGKAARQTLADSIHPLLATRGVPGTHDTQFAIELLTQLKLQQSGTLQIPQFNKAIDDYQAGKSQSIKLPVQVIIFEGWCLGAEAQSPQQLEQAINPLELEHDADGRWRNFVNNALATQYRELFSLIDHWVMLKAPSFKHVFQWREEQEQKLADRISSKQASDYQTDPSQNDQSTHIMNAEELDYFIQHYQRITEHCLSTLPDKVHHLYELNSHRKIIDYSQPLEFPSQ